MSVYYAIDTEAIYHIKDTGYLIHIVNSDEPENDRVAIVFDKLIESISLFLTTQV